MKRSLAAVRCCHGSSPVLSPPSCVPRRLSPACKESWQRRPRSRLRDSARYSSHAPTFYDAKIEDIRNVGIIAHVDAGKTTTTERMLYYSGATRHLGNVDHGDTTTDFLPMERARGITIQSAAISFHWPPQTDGRTATATTTSTTINLIDTPGHQDFRFEVDRCLPVLDGAVCLVDAVKGVEAHTERVWATAQRYDIPRIVFVNKLDRDGASFQRCVLDIASRLNAWPLVCQLPLWDGDRFVGVVDVIERRAMRWQGGGGGGSSHTSSCSLVPDATLRANDTLWAEMETARVRLVERLCEDDDALVEAFAERGADLPAALVKASLRRVVRHAHGRVVPVFAGSSLRSIGVEPLLDAVVDYLPNPREAADVAVRMGGGGSGSGKQHMLSEVVDGVRGKGKSKTKKQPAAGGAVASVFKVVNDPTLFAGTHGMLAFVRVYQGTLHKNAPLWNANLGRAEKPLLLAQVSAATVGEIPYLAAGQIGAVTGLKLARTGDTLHVLPSHSHGTPLADLRTMTIRPPDVGPAVAFVSVDVYGGPTEAKKVEDALAKLAREDPSLRWSRDDKSDAAFVLSGMGQLHLDVAIDRLQTTYGVTSAVFGDVQVDYKECLAVPTTGPHRYEYDRVVANKAGRAACTATVERIEGGEEEKEEVVRGDAARVYTFARDSNQYRIVFPSPPGDDDYDAPLPFDPDMVSRQLFNGAYGALARGPRRGAPLHGCRVTVAFRAATDYGGPGTDGHIVLAALHAVRAALRAAHARGGVGVLEPVMLVHIACPDDTAGAIQRDLAGSRGGFVLEVRTGEASAASAASIDSDNDNSPIDLAQVYASPDPYASVQSLRDPKRGVTRMLELVAKVPLKEMLAYDGRLRSMTGGRHSFTMVLDSFERVVGAREKEV